MVKSRTETCERVALFDNIKFLMITLVVVGHFADVFTKDSDVCKGIYLFIYAFHMPMMLFISGLFYSNKKNTSKILFYVCSGFILKISLAIINLICHQRTGFSLLSDGGSPWFFFVLAAYQLLMYLLRNTNKKFLLIFSILLACFVGYDKSVGSYLYLSRIVVFFPFYLFGTMLSPQKIVSFLNKYSKKLIVIAIVIIAIWFFFCFYKIDSAYNLRVLLTGTNPFSKEIISVGPLLRLLCYCISFLTGAGLLVLMPEKQIPFFSSAGSKTLNVYYWHWLIYSLAERFLHISRLFTLGTAGAIAFFLIAVLLTVILSCFKIFDYPLKTVKQQCFKTNDT